MQSLFHICNSYYLWLLVFLVSLAGCASAPEPVSVKDLNSRSLIFASIIHGGNSGEPLVLKNMDTGVLYRLHFNEEMSSDMGVWPEKLVSHMGFHELYYLNIGLAMIDVPPGRYRYYVEGGENAADELAPDEPLVLDPGRIYYFGALHCRVLFNDRWVWLKSDNFSADLAFANKYRPDIPWKRLSLGFNLESPAFIDELEMYTSRGLVNYPGKLEHRYSGVSLPVELAGFVRKEVIYYRADEVGATYKHKKDSTSIEILIYRINEYAPENLSSLLTPSLVDSIQRRELLAATIPYLEIKGEDSGYSLSENEVAVYPGEEELLLGLTALLKPTSETEDRDFLRFYLFSRGNWAIKYKVHTTHAERGAGGVSEFIGNIRLPEEQ